jgi:hydrogenase maturation protein HypF
MTERTQHTASVTRWRLTIRGVVQGIGFRPFVYRLAQELCLAGWARNTAAGVEIAIEGPQDRLTHFLQRLQQETPPFAHIADIEIAEAIQLSSADFAILPGKPGEDSTLIPPDLATCPLCLEEVLCSRDRRFRYPFANCTNCGPRFTIIRALPYERSATTMAAFALCPSCAVEYKNPADRRFHAEPVACPTCGPRVWLEVENRAEAYRLEGDDITRVAALLRQGAVVAVQGLGGFHLACDATSEEAVRRLRKAKDRLHKPLAIMVATLDEAQTYGQLSTAEAALLTSVHAPIVLVRKRPASPLASALAPDNAYLGVMLPYTPLHHLLVREAGRPLVMTSGNRRDEPLCRTVAEAKEALGGRVDAFLLHNRPIYQRCDDSVFFVADTGPQPVRRSRGYTPLPVSVLLTATVPVLALGAELKNTFCLLRGREAFLSQHIGDMSSLATQQHFAAALEHMQALFKIAPAVVAHDLHPDYATSRYAAATGLPLIGVQHHHAHIVACLADNGATGPVIGVAFDGTGYGPDGAIWGGEFLITDCKDFRRVAHLEYLPLPGGDAAIRQPYRIALAYLFALFGTVPALPFLKQVPHAEQQVILRMIARGVNTPMTSSCGRLFDAVAAIIGLRGEVTYEAQAAIELEAVSCTGEDDDTIYPFTIEENQVRLGPLLARIVTDVQAGVSPGAIGRRFHRTLVEIIRTVCTRVREREGLTTVALSGGCWQNRLLLAATVNWLQEAGFTVYVHRQVPTNDGGISLGQAVVAATRLAASP